MPEEFTTEPLTDFELINAVAGVIYTVDDLSQRLAKLESDYNQMAQLNDMLVNAQITRLLNYLQIRELIMNEIRRHIQQEWRRHIAEVAQRTKK